MRKIVLLGVALVATPALGGMEPDHSGISSIRVEFPGRTIDESVVSLTDALRPLGYERDSYQTVVEGHCNSFPFVPECRLEHLQFVDSLKKAPNTATFWFRKGQHETSPSFRPLVKVTAVGEAVHATIVLEELPLKTIGEKDAFLALKTVLADRFPGQVSTESE